MYGICVLYTKGNVSSSCSLAIAVCNSGIYNSDQRVGTIYPIGLTYMHE